MTKNNFFYSNHSEFPEREIQHYRLRKDARGFPRDSSMLELIQLYDATTNQYFPLGCLGQNIYIQMDGPFLLYQVGEYGHCLLTAEIKVIFEPLFGGVAKSYNWEFKIEKRKGASFVKDFFKNGKFAVRSISDNNWYFAYVTPSNNETDCQGYFNCQQHFALDHRQKNKKPTPLTFLHAYEPNPWEINFKETTLVEADTFLVMVIKNSYKIAKEYQKEWLAKTHLKKTYCFVLSNYPEAPPYEMKLDDEFYYMYKPLSVDHFQPGRNVAVTYLVMSNYDLPRTLRKIICD